jgi:hypothetical protein
MGIRIHRSLRRATVPVVAAFVLVIACDDDSPVEPQNFVQNNLVFAREDGSPIEFLSEAKLFVWCGPWDGDAVPAPSLHIIFGGPSVGDPYWWLRAVADDVTIDEQISFLDSRVGRRWIRRISEVRLREQRASAVLNRCGTRQ